MATQNETRGNGKRLETVILKYTAVCERTHTGAAREQRRETRGLALTFVPEKRRISGKFTLFIR